VAGNVMPKTPEAQLQFLQNVFHLSPFIRSPTPQTAPSREAETRNQCPGTNVIAKTIRGGCTKQKSNDMAT